MLPEINEEANILFAMSMASSPVNGSDKGRVGLIVVEGGEEDAVVDGEVTDVSVTGGVVDFGVQEDNTRIPTINNTVTIESFFIFSLFLLVGHVSCPRLNHPAFTHLPAYNNIYDKG